MVECENYIKVFNEGSEKLISCGTRYLESFNELDEKFKKFLSETTHNNDLDVAEKLIAILNNIESNQKESVEIFEKFREEVEHISKEPKDASAALNLFEEQNVHISYALLLAWTSYDASENKVLRSIFNVHRERMDDLFSAWNRFLSMAEEICSK